MKPNRRGSKHGTTRRSDRTLAGPSPAPLRPSKGPQGKRHSVAKLTEPLLAILADNDPQVLDALHKGLASDTKQWLLEICDDYPALFKSIAQRPPAAILLAISISGISGIDTLRKLSLALPDLPIILLADSASPSLVIDAVRAGARGFLLKPLTPRDLLRALNRAINGWPAFFRQAQAALLTALGPRAASRQFGLTPREEAVLRLLFQSRSDKEISSQLGISVGSVRAHLARIYKKVGAHNRQQAVTNFLRQSPSDDETLCE